MHVVTILGSLALSLVSPAPRVGYTAGTGPKSEAVALVRPPYLQLGTPTSMIVCWRTASPTDSRVRYGVAPGVLNQEVSSSTPVSDHCLGISGLAPTTRYYYDVGSTTTVLGGGTTGHHFTTSPPAGSPLPFTAWVVGDGGNGTPTQQAVMNAMLAEAGADRPTLALFAGDMAYYSGTDQEFTSNFFAPYAEVLKSAVTWPSLGNHEGASTTSGDPGPSTGPYYDAFTLPAAAQAGGVASGTEAYYSFDHGNAHFISLNSDQVSRSPGGAMATWLANDLANTTQDWIVAFFHHPPYTKGTHNSDYAGDSGGRLVEMREHLLPILEAGGTDVVFTGHSHIYERSLLIDGVYGYGTAPHFATPELATLVADGRILDGGDGRVGSDGRYLKPRGKAPHGGTVYVVAGNGGQPTGGAGDHPVTFFAEAANGSTLLSIAGNQLTVRNVRADGVVTDTFTLQKGIDLFLLDRFGGVHEGGGAEDMLPKTPYFGFDAARDMELAADGYYVLDALGGIHEGGGAPALTPETPYFGFDAARDFELAAVGFYVLDGFGGVHAGGGAAPSSPVTPYFGFDIARDLELATTGLYVLDGFGGIHAGGGAPPLTPAAPYFGFDIATDLEMSGPGALVLDGFGGMHAVGGAMLAGPSTPYFGFDVAADLETGPTGYWVADVFGGVHSGGGAASITPPPPYFGADVIGDLEWR